MLYGETIRSGAANPCPDCGKKLEFEVCLSAAGYYIGTTCFCGPYSRETDYFPSQKAALAALETYRRENVLYKART